jgi:hypothetical protein
MTAQNPETPKQPVVVDPAEAPDVFASWAHGFTRRQGNIHITFIADRYNHTRSEPRAVVIGRLVMPIEGMVDMYRGLKQFLKDIGIDPEAPTQPPDQKRTLQ